MDAQNLNAVAYPKLTEAQMAALGGCSSATLKRYRDGEHLFQAGDRDFGFFVVKSGRVEILDESCDVPKTLTVYEPGNFTGEIAHLTGGPALVSAVARGDTEVYEINADGVRQIINLVPELGDTILQAFIARRQLLRESDDFTGIRVIGSCYSSDTFRVREFLAKNRLPFTWLDLETNPGVTQLLKQFGVSETDTPVVTWGRKLSLRNPSDRELAEALGIRRPLTQTTYDLIVVGAGPAGLAAAVYAASEGLNMVVLESAGSGGQAGRSMRIENYLGFPTGISGSELAERAAVQATKFGARIALPTPVTRLTFDGAYPTLHVDGGETLTAKCILIATGADYRRLPAEGCERYEGCGVYHAATLNEAPLCRNAEAVVIGGGNSAGQAAVFLSTIARKVYLIIRGNNLYAGMSAYLARRIEQTPNIAVLLNTTVRAMRGGDHLSEIEIVNNETGAAETISTAAVFSFIGAEPRTNWLPAEIEKDAKQFVRTGEAVARSSHWAAKREPYLLETSRAGVFAAGDVRSDSIKRVASAVGEGAMAVKYVHEYLKGM
ncbi:FAD-dependent oxidoreductase [Hyphomicrobium sp.]|uniref:FAD-dependent oxidoreductase n=1 Tax=Hyphomicrobium sp. TaxID=82 RepID=UPI002D784713|nr:FAD-dependent oxidoreductase [Hyphomicrobium sp.]HET6389825.1 FAD-dependent oxidoreductase [Hyphomicrobium sp.]